MADSAHPPRLLTMNETAARLHVSRRTIKRMLDDGRLEAFRLGDGPKSHVRVDADALDEWLHSEPEDAP